MTRELNKINLIETNPGVYQMSNVFKNEIQSIIKTWIKYQEDTIDNYSTFSGNDLSSDFEEAKNELLIEIEEILNNNKSKRVR